MTSRRANKSRKVQYITQKLRSAYKDGKLTEGQIARLEAIGFEWVPRSSIPLSEADPELAKQWHPTKNGDLTPADVAVGSGRRVWWKCPDCGGEWGVRVVNRTTANTNCPYCSNKKVLPGFNDLATTHPDLAKQWHPTKNGDFAPSDAISGSAKRVWWRCPTCGGEWRTSVALRINQDTGCPYCAGKKVLVGFNDLATTHPKIAAQLHPTKNGSLTPRGVVAGSNKKVWWKCPDCGGEWAATISSRVNGVGCPFGSGKRILLGFNDLATTHPDLAKQWHPAKNGDLTPRDVTAGSDKKVWWRHWHEESQTWHEWRAAISSRQAGNGCPVCARVSLGQKMAKAVIRIEDGAYFPSMKPH